MKYLANYILIIFSLLCFRNNVYSQQKVDRSTETEEKSNKENNFEGTEKTHPSVSLAGHYLEQSKEIELRVVLQTPKVTHLYMKYGATLERSTSANKGFKKIAELKPYNQDEVIKLYESTSDTVEQNKILFAAAYAEKFKEMYSKNNFDDEMDNDTKIFNFINIKSWTKSINVPNILGCAYIDKDIVQGKTYYYRIRLNKFDNLLKNNEVEYRDVMVKAEKTSANSVELKTTSGDSKITLAWENLPYMIDYDLYIKKESDAYYELSKEGYSTVYDEVINHFEGLTNYTTYSMQVYGNNLFGQRIFLGETKAMPRDMTPPPPPLLIKAELENDHILLEWEPPTEFPKDFKGYAVMRSETYDDNSFENVKEINNKTTLKFIDNYKVKNKSVFYKIIALDTANNYSSSNIKMIVPIDSIPPNKPIIQKGSIDSLGVVTIKIEPNSDSDLFGYDLYFANDRNAEFKKLKQYRKIKDNKIQELPDVFYDTITLNTLTKKIFYRIKALDANYNESEASDILEIVKPDKVRPTSPTFVDAKSNENSVELIFNLSQSDDVIEQYLYRKEQGKKYIQIAKFIDANIKTYIDTDVEVDKKYFYTLVAKDQSGLYSIPATPVQGKAFGKRLLERITDLKYILVNNKVKLQWSYPDTKQEITFIIYRSNINGNLVQYKTTLEKEIIVPYHKDRNRYAVKVISKSGAESLISNIVTND